MQSLSLINEFPETIVGLGDIANELVEEFPLFSKPILRPAGSSLDLVRSGRMDALVTSAYYWQSSLPAFAALSGVPFGLTPEEMYVWAWENGREYYDQIGEELGVMIIPMYFTPAQIAGWFRQDPIPREESARPFEGLRIRMPSYGGQIMERLGAQVTTNSLDVSELKQLLREGELDAVEWVDAESDLEAGWNEVTNFALTPGWHERSTVGHLLINRNTWDSLPSSLREDLLTYAQIAGTEDLAASQAAQGRAYREISRVSTLLRYPDWILALMRTSWEDIVTDISRRNPLFQEIIASQRELQEDVAIYAQVQQLTIL